MKRWDDAAADDQLSTYSCKLANATAAAMPHDNVLDCQFNNAEPEGVLMIVACEESATAYERRGVVQYA